jgi:opacity protein-like surface antigen
MNLIARAFVAILLLLSMSGTAHSEEGTKTAAGLKIWMNRWKSEQPGSEGRTSGIGALVGWAAEAEFPNNVFVEASYLVSVSDYSFDHADVTTEVERSDVDMAIGYLFNRNVGVFAGYRSSQFWEKITKNKVTVHGPLIGVRGSVPLNNALSLFGELTFLPWSTKATFAATNEKDTALGWFSRAGVKYVLTREIAGALGYQYETTKGKDTNIKDTFDGATLDLMYSF